MFYFFSFYGLFSSPLGYSETCYLLFPLIISLSSMSTCFCPTLRDARLIKGSEFETRGTRRSVSISSSLMNSYDSVSRVISAECSSQSRRRTLGHGDRYRDRVGFYFLFFFKFFFSGVVSPFGGSGQGASVMGRSVLTAGPPSSAKRLLATAVTHAWRLDLIDPKSSRLSDSCWQAKVRPSREMRSNKLLPQMTI